MLFVCILRKSASIEKIWFCLPTCASWDEVVHPVTSYRTCLRHTRDVTRYSMTSRQLGVVINLRPKCQGRLFLRNISFLRTYDTRVQIWSAAAGMRSERQDLHGVMLIHRHFILGNLTECLANLFTDWIITLHSNSLDADELSTIYQHTFLDFT